MELSPRQAEFHAAITHQMTTREALEAMGGAVDSNEMDKARRVLSRMASAGTVQRVAPGVWAPSGAAVTPVAGAYAPPPPAAVAVATDPWGDDITEEDCRRSVSDALAHHLDLLAKRDPKEAVREAFRAGLYMANRPLPGSTPTPAQIVAPVASEAPTSGGSVVRLELPEGWTYDDFARRAKAAVGKGRLKVESVAAGMDLDRDYCDKVLRGRVEPTRDMLERFYAATYRHL